MKQEALQSRSGPYRLTRASAIVALVLGFTVLAGWTFNLPILQSVWPGGTRVPPNGGWILLLLASALLSKIDRPSTKTVRAVANIASLAASTIGLLTLLEYFSKSSNGVDLWIFKNSLVATQMPFPGRLAFPVALAAFWLGLGIALLDFQIKGVWITQLFAILTAVIAMLALLGHACNAPEFYGQLDKQKMFIPPQIMPCLLLLAAGVLCARPERGLIALLWSYTPGGILARWLLLAPAVGLFLTGVVYWIFTKLIPVEQSLRTWAMGFANLSFVMIPILAAAYGLHRIGIQRDRAHQELEERVRQRTAELSEARDHLEQQAIQLEQRVQERTAKLAESVGDLEAFSYSVAHDMRAPLRGMQGFASILLAEHAAHLNEEARDYLDRIALSASRMDLLIQDALDYTQVLRAETDLKVVDLDKITRQLVQAFPGWQPPSAEINIIGTLPPALGHEALLVQCLTNLVGNAVKFVAPKTTPRIQIWAEPLQTHLRLYIEDNGIGIISDNHDRIFRMFERLNPADEYEGTGIGLAVVRKAVERMKGRVDFESEPGRGTKFWIELIKPTLA